MASSIRSDEAIRKGTVTIRELEDERLPIKDDRRVVVTNVSGTGNQLLLLKTGTPTNMMIANTGTAVGQKITLALQRVSDSVKFHVLSVCPHPTGSTIVLNEGELSFDTALYSISVQLAVTSGTASANIITRF